MKSKSALLLIAAILLCAPAFATKIKHVPPPKPAPTSDVTSNSVSASQSTASASQAQTAHSTSNAAASNQGNAQNVNVADVRELAIAPAIVAPSIYPSAVCYSGKSLGASVGNSGYGAGITAGKTVLDKDCSKRETARSFAAVGNLAAANALLCATEDAKEVFGPDGCPAVGGVRTLRWDEDVSSAVPSDFVTRTELVAREKKLLEAATSK